MAGVWRSTGRAVLTLGVLAVIGVVIFLVYGALLVGPPRSSPLVLWVENREEATLRGGRIFGNGERRALHLSSPVASGVRAKFVFNDLAEQDVSLALYRRDGSDRRVELGYPTGGETLTVSIVAQGDSLRVAEQVRAKRRTAN